MGEAKKEKIFPDDYWHYDKAGAYKNIINFPDYIKKGYSLGEGIKPEPFSNVVIAGMGGSGIGGDLLKELLEYDQDCPFIIETCKGYDIPKSVKKSTLFIAISYSGNTEETLSTYKMASRTGCQVILISNGGKLEELAKFNKHRHIKLPTGLQPRMAVAHMFFCLLHIMENTGFTKKYSAEIEDLVNELRRIDLAPKAIDLSEKCFQKIPLIYADQSQYSIAYRWKTQINENAKTTAFSHAISECNHNEILAFDNKTADYHCILLNSDKEHRRIKKRFELYKEALQKKHVSVTEIASKGPLLKQMFTAIYLGDLTSFFLALRYQTDPTPVVIIEQLKKDMGPFLI
jgi:glucose/mannose-6-phosphate isomerase